jgi:hypothetical protein
VILLVQRSLGKQYTELTLMSSYLGLHQTAHNESACEGLMNLAFAVIAMLKVVLVGLAFDPWQLREPLLRLSSAGEGFGPEICGRRNPGLLFESRWPERQPGTYCKLRHGI